MEAANITGADRHAERAGQVRRALGLRERQAALLQSSHHGDEDADADRARSSAISTAGHAAVVQIVSTGEALMERRLAEIPTEEWSDVQVDITPREYVLDYLAHSFPVQLYEPFTDSEGNLSSRPVYRDGQPVAVPRGRRPPRPPDRAARLAAARSRRARPDRAALRHRHGRRGHGPLAPHRPQDGRTAPIASSSRTAPAPPISPRPQAFMDDEKRILVFSDAGGTGRTLSRRSVGAKNRRLRVHYLLEAGLEGRRRHSGPRPHQPHQPGAAAAVPADRDRCEGREALPLAPSRAASTRSAPSPAASARPAARACSAPRTISKAPMRATRCASSICCSSRGKVEGCSLETLRGRDRPEADRRERHQGRAAADHDLPQPPAGADHRSAEHAVHRVRAIADRQHRGRDRRPAPMTSGWRR